MNALPVSCSKTYLGPITDSRVWPIFTLRPDDIIVATPPKCGTTWMQAICLMLIFGRPGMDIELDKLSRWLDCAFRDRDVITSALNALTHRRCIKTHTALDGITYDPNCTYIAVYRHPVDAHFSMRQMSQKLRIELLQSRFPEDVHDAFMMFCNDADPTRGTDDMTLFGLVEHYLSYKRWERLPNVHLFHYADMTRDLAGQIDRVADILGYEYSDAVMAQITDGARFEKMQHNAIHAKADDPATNAIAPKDFFHNATSNKWEGRLSAADMDHYAQAIAKLLPEEDVAWLQWGNTGASK